MPKALGMKKAVLANIVIASALFCVPSASTSIAQHRKSKSVKRLWGDKFVPIWSKDGKWISFNNQASATESRIYLISPDGLQLRDLTGHAGTISYIAANGRILFRSPDKLEPHDDEIFSVNLDGSGLKQLTNNLASDMFGSWSSDLSRIAFITDRDGRSKLYLMNADGSQQVSLSQSLNTIEGARPPSWSPDDQWVVFNANSDSDNEIYRIHPDGTGLGKLTDNKFNDFNPSYSPDGKYIAFISNRTGSRDQLDNRIFIMKADGSEQHQVGNISPIHGSLSWSPQGEQITFNAFSTYVVEIFTMQTDGSHLRQLTFSPVQPLVVTLKSKGVAVAQTLFRRLKKNASAQHSFTVPSMRRLGDEFVTMGKYRKAIAAFGFLVDLYPTDAGFWASLGDAQRNSGDRENAILSLKKSLTLNPAPPLREMVEQMLRELSRTSP